MTIDQPEQTQAIFHYSRSPKYRTPFGAVPAGTYVDLCVDVKYESCEVILCYSYGLYSFSYSEMRMNPLEDRPDRYSAKIRMPGEPGLFFYWFKVKKESSGSLPGSEHEGSPYQGFRRLDPEKPAVNSDNGILGGVPPISVQYYVMSRKKSDGTGRISDEPSRIGAHEDRYPAAFQITVFRKDFRTPDWFKGALLYQIFPDRFFRGAAYTAGQMQSARKAQERIYHEDWYEDVDIFGTPQTGYLACDFFGGTLDGITEKIRYFKELHIDCLYLNPIFESRSNHRYDTADYLSADPMLGGNLAFERFSGRMKENQIAFLMDGVFSHTGADSRYFNKLDRYEEHGAYQTAQGKGSSKYSSWYSFSRDDAGSLTYDSWWGFTDLPNVNENDLSFREYVLGKDGVIETWMSKGASGFRLDVSDELPDSFLRELRSVVKENSDQKGIVLGEVWEDASNKISYGSYRDFLLGNSHDCVMGYTFRDALLGFLTGAFTARDFNARMESFRENYPPEAYYCIMNLVSSHDVPRTITVLCGAPDPGDRKAQRMLTLDDASLKKGLALMRLALVIQMGYIGSPCIYYGDEIGMQGYKDPFNRRTYPWDRITDQQKEQLAFYQSVTGLRREYPVLKTGAYRTLWANDDAYIFERFLDDQGNDFFGRPCEGVHRIVIAVNRSDTNCLFFTLEHDVSNILISQPPDLTNDKDSIQIIPLDMLSTDTFVGPLSYRIFTFA